MKSLHRKISIMVLAGMVVLGGGLAGSLSVANANGLDFAVQQAQVDLEGLRGYGEKAGFEVIHGSNIDARNLDENGGVFDSVLDLCNFIYNQQGDLVQGGLYKANVGGSEVVIKVAPSGIQDVAPEDVF